MHSGVVSAARSMGHVIAHFARIPALFAGIDHPSYSGRASRKKGMPAIVADYLYLFFIRGMLPRHYRLWQFDSKKRPEFSAYLDEPDSPFLRRQLYSILWDVRYTMLVNDKHLFHCFCRSQQLPTPKLCGVLHDGRLISECADFRRNLEGNRDGIWVIKPANGVQGLGIHFMSGHQLGRMFPLPDHGIAPEMDGFKEGVFVIEEYIRQHSAMKEINPDSVNTVRLITLLTRQNSVILLSGMLRTSASENRTDNFSTGGIVVGIDLSSGKLRETGFLDPAFGTTVTVHPRTKIRFKDLQIPFWGQICALAEKAQQSFHQLKAIGWDIAVTESGPILIEGNIEWGTAGIQAANGGLLTPLLREKLADYHVKLK